MCVGVYVCVCVCVKARLQPEQVAAGVSEMTVVKRRVVEMTE